jgi:epidermal growth factor receptor
LLLQGFWVPDKESIKIPVAIKVLSTEGSVTEQNKELLDEARIMFSVNHVCCVRVIAICMAQQMMLVTQLMPLGCLLDYVRKNKSHIGSRDLLTWSTQIAKVNRNVYS